MRMCVCMCMMLTVVCLEGLGLDYLTAVAAHHQVEVVLCGTLAKYGHVCTWEGKMNQTRHKSRRGKLNRSVFTWCPSWQMYLH